MNNDKPPSCFLCCNVITGTMLKAFFVLISGFLILSGSILERSGYIDLSSSVDDEFSSKMMQYYNSSDKAFAVTILNGLFLMIIGSLALVGVAKSRSRLLLPLFVVQISEMIAVMGALCSVIFLPDKLQIFINEIKHLAGKDLRNWIMGFDDTWRCIFAVTYFSILLSVNILFVRVIFQCYKYLTTQDAIPRRPHEITIITMEDQQADTPTYKLPKYEDLQKMPFMDVQDNYPVKPPAYQI